MTELTLTRGDTITVSWTLASRTRNARTGTYTNTPIDITDATCRIYFRGVSVDRKSERLPRVTEQRRTNNVATI